MIELTPGEYQSEPMVIGKHEWRVVKYLAWIVVQHEWCTGYEWRPVGSVDWRSEKEWPTFDADNGQTAGLPASVRKLFDRELPALTGAAAQQLALI